MITIINYGLGNVQAFANLYKRLNIAARIASSAAELDGASKLILPGVGAFDHAMESFEESGMRQTVDDLVLRQGKPVLGVCVGMQMLARGSEEGTLPGLGWVDGQVRRFDANKLPPPGRLPHMGWNDVIPRNGAGLFAGLERDSRFYFLHSYYFDCASNDNILATSEYGIEFGCAVRSNNVHGVQFHPEKSHDFGIRLLKNFAEL
ncbi:imidazole glycerol phosphate synthase subunit HisH [Bradyrhizobium lablabi]|uniref:imidazole glycerol phosphate synthase subunit HisH n=1 Tax=Bradyrhizobium lablabi TaxID=722472 RepID=UPI001BACEB7E|nr:imidazole glycerol phosphate synthase subunit HisH [Bradyrhizobium lablabi]MBR1120203.1 imidazole glycerol phosphate synthase subunit HisH [Bradyrhizobium lablabi]